MYCVVEAIYIHYIYSLSLTAVCAFVLSTGSCSSIISVFKIKGKYKIENCSDHRFIARRIWRHCRTPSLFEPMRSKWKEKNKKKRRSMGDTDDAGRLLATSEIPIKSEMMRTSNITAN